MIGSFQTDDERRKRCFGGVWFSGWFSQAGPRLLAASFRICLELPTPDHLGRALTFLKRPRTRSLELSWSSASLGWRGGVNHGPFPLPLGRGA